MVSIELTQVKRNAHSASYRHPLDVFIIAHLAYNVKLRVCERRKVAARSLLHFVVLTLFQVAVFSSFLCSRLSTITV